MLFTAKFGRHLKWQVFLWKLVFRNEENWPIQNHEDVLQMHNIHALNPKDLVHTKLGIGHKNCSWKMKAISVHVNHKK